MNATFKEAEREILRSATSVYTTRAERAAVRGGMADAVALLDAFAKDVCADYRRRGKLTKTGEAYAALLTRAADAIWLMREKVTVPHEGGVEEDA